MARHKEFDPDEVLQRAIGVFHERGYEATSMSQLVEVMGIGRGSMYETYGSKQSLFLAAFERYIERLVASWRERLEGSDRPADAVRALIRDVSDNSAAARRGCLIGNTCAELAPRDPRIADACGTALARLEGLIADALSRAQDNGDLAADKKPRALARFLVTGLQGTAVVGKASAGGPRVRDSVRLLLAALD